MTGPVEFAREGDVALITIDAPPVNALGHAVRAGLWAALDQAEADPEVTATVIAARGSVFIGGADMSEFGAPRQPPVLGAICDRIEAMATPVVVALHGAALGGGCELALAAHARVATAEAELALPEVLLGLMPGAGGTQRATRLAGPQVALPWMLTGRRMPAAEAQANGLVDHVVSALIPEATALARTLAADGRPLRRSRELPVPGTADEHAAAIAAARAEHLTSAQVLASPAHIITAVELACTRPAGATREEEAALFAACVESPPSRALVHLFFAERAAARGAERAAARGVERSGSAHGGDSSGKARTVETVGVVGGGTMGTGIAQAALDAELRVVLVEQDAERSVRARETIASAITARVAKGRLTEATAAAQLARLTSTTQLAALHAADLVIEAVFEDLEVKRALFTQLSAICAAGTILATNTSYLDVDAIAGATTRPQDVIGLHFFSPAQVMKLVEVVVPPRASADAVATGFAVARRLRKIGVRSGVCDGFIGNRMLMVYRRAAEYLMLDGASPYAIDDAVRQFGFPMGPFQVMDLAGGDIAWATRKRRAAVRDRAERYVTVADQLCERGWFGRKTGRGWYRYPEGSRAGVPDDEVLALLAAERQRVGITPRDFSAEEIIERYLAAMINEGARVLGDGIAQRSSDIDVVLVHGYGFPRHRGGPMHHADATGPQRWLATIERLSIEDPHFWQPAPLLRSVVERGTTFSQHQP